MAKEKFEKLSALSEETQRAAGIAIVVCAVVFLVWAMLGFRELTNTNGATLEAGVAALVFVGLAASAAYLGRVVFEGGGRHVNTAIGIFLLALGAGIGGMVLRATVHAWPIGLEHAVFVAAAAVLFSAGIEFLGVRRGLTLPLVIAGLLIFAAGYYNYNIGEKTYDIWLKQGSTAAIINGNGAVLASATSDNQGLARLSITPARAENASLVVDGAAYPLPEKSMVFGYDNKTGKLAPDVVDGVMVSPTPMANPTPSPIPEPTATPSPTPFVNDSDSEMPPAPPQLPTATP